MTAQMRCSLAMTVMVLLVGRTAAAQQTENPSNSVQVEPASIYASRDIELGASEAGIITEMNAIEGASVGEGQEIARIDDRQTQMQKQVAEVTLQAAEERANDQIEIEYAQAAQRVAEADYDRMIKSNAFPKAEVERAQLDALRSRLAVEKAKKDQMLAGFDAQVSKAELDAADKAIERRTVRAPFDGEIVELITHEGEWAHPGDPLVRLVKLDTLHVDGRVEFAQIAPHQVRNCRVTVVADIGGGRTHTATGRIIFVGSEIHGFEVSEYVVRGEIPNVRHNDGWLILPGAQATMTIHLGTQQPELGISP